jgi:predicted O-methyltransferase YrrM
MAIYLGDRLGWYRELAQNGPQTATELADATATSARYAREWLEHQAACGMLAFEPAASAWDRRYAIPPGVAEALTDTTSLSYAAPLAQMFAASALKLDSLLDAYRTGGGVSWAQFGDHARESQAAVNRPWFSAMPQVLASLPHIHGLLSAPGARAADVGCGFGWSTISIALAYPSLQIDGFDIDEPSIEAARRNAREAGIADRVSFHASDAAGLAQAGPFDAVFAFECIHDMPRPVEVLAAMRAGIRDSGSVIVMDEAVADELISPAEEIDQMMYAYSLFVCLPDGLSHPPSVGTGTVMRPSILRDYGRAAGFSDLEVLPTGEFGFWRFYELTH